MLCLDENVIAELVEGCLAADRRAEVLGHLDSCAACRVLVAAAAAPPSVPEGDARRARAVLPAGAQVGRYFIIELVGVGAMGIVYRALDPELAREIALKVLRDGDDATPEALGVRLVAEAKALARLAHPNVVAVHDVGVADGQVFIAMELGRETLSSWLRRVRPGAGEILEVLRQAGAGLAAAHAAGIVHGDFKPDNVLVGADGRPRVSDFGLAHGGPGGTPLPDDAPLDRAALTATGGLTGTPAYMGLEQLRGGPGDARSDQFAFCATVFEALTGQLPFRAPTLGALRERVAGGQVEAASARRLPAWLRKIVLRGLRVQPAERWPDMASLLAALDRGPRRQRLRAALLAALAAVALAAATLALVSVARVMELRRVAEARADELIVLQAQSALDADPTAALAWLKQLPAGAANWRDAIPIARDAVSRGVAERVVRSDAGPVWAVAASPDGRHYASAHGSVVALADLAGGTVDLRAHDGEVTRLAFAADGQRLASAGGGKIIVWDLGAAPAPAATLAGHLGEIQGMVFSRDGRTLAATGDDGLIRLWDVAAARPRVVADAGRRCNDVAFAADERTLAVACTGARILVVPLAGGEPRILTTADPLPRSVAFLDAPELGAALLVAGRAGAEILRVDGGAAPAPAAARGAILAAALAPAADRVLYGTLDQGSRVIGLSTQSSLATLVGQKAAVYSAALFPDGRTAITGALDGSVRVWRLPAAGAPILAAGSELHALGVAPDGARVAAGGADGKMRLWDLVRGGAPQILDAGPGTIDWLRLLPDGRVVTIADSGAVWLWSGAERQSLGGGQTAVASVAVSAAADALAWSDSESVHLRGLGPTGFTADLPMPSNAELVFTGGGALLAFGVGDEIGTCEAARCAATRTTLARTERPVESLAVPPDGATLVASTAGGQLHVIDAATGARRVLGGGRGDLLYLAVAPDGRSVASADLDGRVELWDVASGARRELWRHALRSTALEFSRDGATLVGAGKDGTIRVADMATGEQRILRGHDGPVLDMVVFGGGDRLASAGADGTLRIWSIAGDEPRFAAHEDLTAWLAARTSAVIDREHRATSP